MVIGKRSNTLKLPIFYGGDRSVDGLWHALDGLIAKFDNLIAKADKLDTILEELCAMIVGSENVHINHKGGYYGAIRHPIMSK
ncbi:hypothetical protein L1987_14910 [Smallanthus sonchifolius]|uniref:Uncharacterized protein n=1 Tax=Smallanthus sonchifolius TaxID=185202 RepID=A0ACB9J4M8_9ASTR|nr:hypothetical protein L1987_14910 [Smallanthus sonchifolius]